MAGDCHSQTPSACHTLAQHALGLWYTKDSLALWPCHATPLGDQQYLETQPTEGAARINLPTLPYSRSSSMACLCAACAWVRSVPNACTPWPFVCWPN